MEGEFSGLLTARSQEFQQILFDHSDLTRQNIFVPNIRSQIDTRLYSTQKISFVNGRMCYKRKKWFFASESLNSLCLPSLLTQTFGCQDSS